MPISDGPGMRDREDSTVTNTGKKVNKEFVKESESPEDIIIEKKEGYEKRIGYKTRYYESTDGEELGDYKYPEDTTEISKRKTKEEPEIEEEIEEDKWQPKRKNYASFTIKGRDYINDIIDLLSGIIKLVVFAYVIRWGFVVFVNNMVLPFSIATSPIVGILTTPYTSELVFIGLFIYLLWYILK